MHRHSNLNRVSAQLTIQILTCNIIDDKRSPRSTFGCKQQQRFSFRMKPDVVIATLDRPLAQSCTSKLVRDLYCTSQTWNGKHGPLSPQPKLRRTTMLLPTLRNASRTCLQFARVSCPKQNGCGKTKRPYITGNFVGILL